MVHILHRQRSNMTRTTIALALSAAIAGAFVARARDGHRAAATSPEVLPPHLRLLLPRRHRRHRARVAGADVAEPAAAEPRVPRPPANRSHLSPVLWRWIWPPTGQGTGKFQSLSQDAVAGRQGASKSKQTRLVAQLSPSPSRPPQPPLLPLPLHPQARPPMPLLHPPRAVVDAVVVAVAARSCWVYVPAGYKEGTELPFMVDHDGGERAVVQTQLIAAMDLLIAQKKIPMMAGVFIALVESLPWNMHTVSGVLRGLHRNRGAPSRRKNRQNQTLAGPGSSRFNRPKLRRTGGAGHGVVTTPPPSIASSFTSPSSSRRSSKSQTARKGARNTRIPSSPTLEKNPSSHLDGSPRFQQPKQPVRQLAPQQNNNLGQRPPKPRDTNTNSSEGWVLGTLRRRRGTADDPAEAMEWVWKTYKVGK